MVIHLITKHSPDKQFAVTSLKIGIEAKICQIDATAKLSSELSSQVPVDRIFLGLYQSMYLPIKHLRLLHLSDMRAHVQ